MLRIQATPQPVEHASSLKASTNKRGSKRKLAGSEGPARSSPSAPPVDSSTVANPPQFISTAFTRPDGSKLYLTRGHPPNKFGFRYQACGPSDISTPERPFFKLIQSHPADTAKFSWEDRSPYVFISEDAKSVSTDKGFRSARANVPLRGGIWYFEVIIERGGGETTGEIGASKAHVRIGIGRRECNLNAPVGMDAYSYGLRDKTGDRVTVSQPKPHGESFGTGDVIGVLVHLPRRSPSPTQGTDPLDPATIIRKRVPIRYKGQLYFESLEYIPAREMIKLVDNATEASLPPQKQVKQKAAAPGMKHQKAPTDNTPPPRDIPVLKGSSVHFFKNGKPMNGTEPAFSDLYDYLPLRASEEELARKGKKKKNRNVAYDPMLDRENFNDDGTLGYYPIVSCYGGGIVRLNPGPELQCPPEMLAFETSEREEDKVLTGFSLLDERYRQYLAECAGLDDAEERYHLQLIQQQEAQQQQIQQMQYQRHMEKQIARQARHQQQKELEHQASLQMPMQEFREESEAKPTPPPVSSVDSPGSGEVKPVVSGIEAIDAGVNVGPRSDADAPGEPDDDFGGDTEMGT